MKTIRYILWVLRAFVLHMITSRCFLCDALIPIDRATCGKPKCGEAFDEFNAW